jgi:hypothetical protein
LIGEDVDDGRVATPLPLDELAYTVVRICESYLYLPAITGDHRRGPGPGRARPGARRARQPGVIRRRLAGTSRRLRGRGQYTSVEQRTTSPPRGT